MKYKQMQRSVLVVSSSEAGISFISELLDSYDYYPITVAKSGNEARRLLISESFDIVIINAPLSDEFGHELALYVSEDFVAGTILIVKSEIFDEVCNRVEDYGILTVAKPISKFLFHQTMKLLDATLVKLKRYEKEQNKLKIKMEELCIVNRAKCVLVEYLQMSEVQAHHYIEKQAMDMRTTKREIAEGILKTYEN